MTTEALPRKNGVERGSDLVLDVRELDAQFYTREGVVRAVRSVSLKIERGEAVALVGESGSGKSTLGLSILGLVEPPGQVVGGQVILNGRDIARLSDREMQRVRGKEVSLIFQDAMTALDPVKKIGDQIVEIIRRHQDISRRAARRLAISLLRDVEVPNADRRLDDYPHQYSGGMRQRVMIAISLANEPDLLIADEPATALDVTTQAQVLDLLEKLVAERNTAVLLITHNLGVVAEFCQRILVMYAGRVIESGDAEQVFARQTHPYTEVLLRSVPRPDRLQHGPLPTIPGFPPSLAHLPLGCSFEPRCPIGNGVETCISVSPLPVTVGQSLRPVVAECHFADDRWAGRLPIAAASMEEV